MAAAKRAAQKPRKPTPERVVDAAMALAAERRWRDISLGDIAEAAKISLAELHEMFRSKQAILAAFIDRIDGEVLTGTDAEAADEPVRERLLDVLMRRFEALAPYKRSVASIVRDGAADPVFALCTGPRLLRSMAWCLEAAGIGSSGLIGRIRTKGLAAIYASATVVWLRDDSEDMGRTMAHLDRRLRGAERLISVLSGPCNRRADPAGEAVG